MKTNDVTFKAAGEAGAGIATIGNMFAKLMQRCGLYVFCENDYPSLIRGGHNTITVRANQRKIYALNGKIDLLIALNKEGVNLHLEEMEEGGVIIYDSTKVKKEELETTEKNVRLFATPLSEISAGAGGQIYLNEAAMGAAMAVLGLDLKLLESLIEEAFADKGEEVVASNKKAVRDGFEHVKSNAKREFEIKIEPKKYEGNLLINGNDAACMGAIKAGVRLVAEYPMSPSSSVLHWMAQNATHLDIVVKHTEDEIAAINYILGAGFAGVRAMTATSGGGFALMNEALGNGGLAEIPCVIINVQRCGPSTGLPTYTEQADLRFALHASQGEFPRIVCMPGDSTEAFYETFNVWNMAELVQTPAIILLDKYMGESLETVEKFEHEKLEVKRGMLQTDEQMDAAEDFLRHKITNNGISPRCVAGQKNGRHVASSYEHDETGYTSEDPDNRILQIDKRARKLKAINPNLYQPVFYGDSKSTLLVVSWGSTKGVVLEALEELRKENISARFMHIKYAIPFATDTIRQALQSASKTIIFEGNSEGQMRNYIREKTGILVGNMHLKYDGRPFLVNEIMEQIRELAAKQ